VGLGLVFLGPLSEALHFPNHPEYLMLLLAITALDTFAALPFARLRLENRPLRFASARILQILLNIVFLFLLLEYWRVEDRIAAVFWANLLANGLVLLLLLPVFFRVRLQFDRALMRRMLVYAMPLVVVGLAAVVNQLIALPLMETWLPGSLEENRAQAGIYGAALKLAVLMNLFTQAFNYAAEPFFFRNADRSDAREHYAQIARLFTLAGCLAFLGVTLYMDLIKHLIGPEFRAGIGLVPIVLLAYLFMG
jgi:O-antigen/teichoic acid export membrane protein